MNFAIGERVKILNYINELNVFYDRLETNNLSQSAVVLWHTLMHINYKTGWKEEFAVARSVIEAKTGMKKDAYYTARNQLKTAGLIQFRARGNKATLFSLSELSSEKTEASVKQTVTPTTTQTVTPTATPTFISNKDIKEVEEEVKENSIKINPFTFYEQNFGMLHPFVIDQIETWTKDLSDVLVVEAMKEALKKNVVNFKYCEAILRDWRSKGVKSLEDAANVQQRFKKGTNIRPFKQKQGQQNKAYDYGF